MRDTFQRPQPARLGYLKTWSVVTFFVGSRLRSSLKSPNREVGDRSFQPTKDRCLHRVSNPPTGRLGIVHSSLQRSLPSPCLKSPNREVGDRSFQPMSRH